MMSYPRGFKLVPSANHNLAIANLYFSFLFYFFVYSGMEIYLNI